MVAHRQGIRGPNQTQQSARDLWPRSVRHPVTFRGATLVPISGRSPIFLCAIPPLLPCKGFVEAPAVPPTAGAFFDLSSRGFGWAFGGRGYDSRNGDSLNCKTDCKKTRDSPGSRPHGKLDHTERKMTSSARKMALATMP